MKPTTKRKPNGALIVFIIGVMISVSVGLFASYAALDHNPMEEFCIYHDAFSDECDIRWGPLAFIFFGWFVVTLAVSLPLGYLFVLPIAYLTRAAHRRFIKRS